MEKKRPMRRCVGCGISKDKDELVRIIRDANGELHADFTGRANGRGAYICNNSKCLEKAAKRRGFEKSFREAVPVEALKELEKELAQNG